jgi:hypothetical protein
MCPVPLKAHMAGRKGYSKGRIVKEQIRRVSRSVKQVKRGAAATMDSVKPLGKRFQDERSET